MTISNVKDPFQNKLTDSFHRFSKLTDETICNKDHFAFMQMVFPIIKEGGDLNKIYMPNVSINICNNSSCTRICTIKGVNLLEYILDMDKYYKTFLKVIIVNGANEINGSNKIYFTDKLKASKTEFGFEEMNKKVMEATRPFLYEGPQTIVIQYTVPPRLDKEVQQEIAYQEQWMKY